MKLEPDILADYAEYVESTFAGVLPDPGRMCAAMFSEDKAQETLRSIERHTGKVRGKRLLEVGCGNGMFLAAARRAGALAFGVEPDWTSVRTASRVINAYDMGTGLVTAAVGERLPFGNEQFDMVSSSYVLEHASDMEATFQECIRVLKGGGYAHFLLPNHGSIWEGHYRVFWLPYQPKWLARIWVRLFGRDPSFLDTLHLITVGKLANILRQFERNVHVVTYGYEMWRGRLMASELGVWGERIGWMRRLVGVLHKMGLVRVVALCVRAMRAYYPIVLILKKER